MDLVQEQESQQLEQLSREQELLSEYTAPPSPRTCSVTLKNHMCQMYVDKKFFPFVIYDRNNNVQ